MRHHRFVKRLLVGLAGVLVLAGACTTEETGAPTAAPDELSLTLGDVPSSVEGNVLEIPVDVEGVEIVAPDGDTSGETGHFHVFIDREPLAEGETIPREAGIVHSAEEPIKLYGLSVGEHTFTVVLGDGAHTRIHEDLEESLTVTVDGPSVDGTAPATLEEGEDLTVELSSEGVEIVSADGDTSGETGHYHLLVDPEEPPEAGETLPPAEEGKVIHTTESSATLSGLAAGEHVIWVVLGDGEHTAFDPPVMDRLTVTVS